MCNDAQQKKILTLFLFPSMNQFLETTRHNLWLNDDNKNG